MSDTPETDDQPIIYAMNDNGYQVPCVDLEFSRRLERERDEAREEIDNIRKMLSESGEAVGNGEHDYSIIDMIENLIKSKDYFVRKSDSLEHERDEARAELKEYRSIAENIGATKAVSDRDKAVAERDEAREEIKELIYIAERAIALAEIDFENDKFGVVSELRYELKQIMQEGAK